MKEKLLALWADREQVIGTDPRKAYILAVVLLAIGFLLGFWAG